MAWSTMWPGQREASSVMAAVEKSSNVCRLARPRSSRCRLCAPWCRITKLRRSQDWLPAGVLDYHAAVFMDWLRPFWQRWGRFERFRTGQTPLTPLPAAA